MSLGLLLLMYACVGLHVHVLIHTHTHGFTCTCTNTYTHTHKLQERRTFLRHQQEQGQGCLAEHLTHSTHVEPWCFQPWYTYLYVCVCVRTYIIYPQIHVKSTTCIFTQKHTWQLHTSIHGSCTQAYMAVAHKHTWQLHTSIHGSYTQAYMAVTHKHTWQLHTSIHGK
jgi:hypothetical protein